MPKALNVWMGNKISKNAAVSTLIIREKAKHLYKCFVSDSSEVSNSKVFQGSKGCSEIFKALWNIQKVPVFMIWSWKLKVEYLALIMKQQHHSLVSFRDHWDEGLPARADETGLQGCSANISSHVVHKNDTAAPGFKAAKDRYRLYILLECCLWLYAETYAQQYVNEPSSSKMQKLKPPCSLSACKQQGFGWPQNIYGLVLQLFLTWSWEVSST